MYSQSIAQQNEYKLKVLYLNNPQFISSTKDISTMLGYKFVIFWGWVMGQHFLTHDPSTFVTY